MVQLVDLVENLTSWGLSIDEAEALLDASPAFELTVYVGSRRDCLAWAQVRPYLHWP